MEYYNSVENFAFIDRRQSPDTMGTSELSGDSPCEQPNHGDRLPRHYFYPSMRIDLPTFVGDEGLRAANTY